MIPSTVLRLPPRHVLVLCVTAFAVATAHAQPLSEPPVGFVPAERLRQSEAELKKVRQTQAELAEARSRIALLESQLRDAERALQKAQNAAIAAKPPTAKSPSATETTASLGSQSQTVQPALKPSLVDGQELSVPGCGAACPTFIVLPQSGRVTMGTGEDARSVEFKYRVVMGKTEVTVAQWKNFILDSRYRLVETNSTLCDWKKEAISDQHPVRCISPSDALAYANWFQKKYASKFQFAIRQFDLPTRDEWEYAARAGRWTQDRQWDGLKVNCGLAASSSCSNDKPDPVAKKGRLPNAWGLYDTIGNVGEMAGLNSSFFYVLGGSYQASTPIDLRLSNYDVTTKELRLEWVGFRLIGRVD